MDEQTKAIMAGGTMGASLVALGFAGIAMVGTAISNMNSRKAARDKLEMKAATARDRLQFDAKIVKLESDQKRCIEDHAECAKETAVIKAKLQACEEHHDISAKDRQAMWSEIEKLKSQSA